MRYILMLIMVFMVSAASAADITLSWTDNSTNEDGFIVEQSEIGFPWMNIATTAANATSHPVTVDEMKLFCWRVYAFNTAGRSLPSNTVCLLPAPSGLTF